MKTLVGLQEVLKLSLETLQNPDLQVPTLMTFLEIGQREDLPMTELQKAVGVSQAAISRIVAKLGRGLLHEEGLGLVEAYEDPEWRRRKLVRLTPKGKEVQKIFAKRIEHYANKVHYRD